MLVNVTLGKSSLASLRISDNDYGPLFSKNQAVDDTSIGFEERGTAKCLIDIAVSDQDKLDELEEEAEG